MVQGYIAFVDLVGTSRLATTDPDRYFESSRAFQFVVEEYAKDLKEGSVYFFSDSAYAYSADLKPLALFLQNMRQHLLEQGIFLKAAIAAGQLNAEPRTNSADGSVRSSGVIFGKDIVRAYQLHNDASGIVIAIDGSAAEQAALGTLLVNTCQIARGSNNQLRATYDLALKEPLHQDTLKRLMKIFFKAKTQSTALGKYYIPLLITSIEALDLTSQSQSEESATPELEPLVHMLLRGGFYSNFSEIRGIEAVYFALLEKMYREMPIPGVIRLTENFVANRKKLVSRFELVPRLIFSDESRIRFLDFLSEKLRTGF